MICHTVMHLLLLHFITVTRVTSAASGQYQKRFHFFISIGKSLARTLATTWRVSQVQAALSVAVKLGIITQVGLIQIHLDCHTDDSVVILFDTCCDMFWSHVAITCQQVVRGTGKGMQRETGRLGDEGHGCGWLVVHPWDLRGCAWKSCHIAQSNHGHLCRDGCVLSDLSLGRFHGYGAVSWQSHYILLQAAFKTYYTLLATCYLLKAATTCHLCSCQPVTVSELFQAPSSWAELRLEGDFRYPSWASLGDSWRLAATCGPAPEILRLSAKGGERRRKPSSLATVSQYNPSHWVGRGSNSHQSCGLLSPSGPKWPCTYQILQSVCRLKDFRAAPDTKWFQRAEMLPFPTVGFLFSFLFSMSSKKREDQLQYGITCWSKIQVDAMISEVLETFWHIRHISTRSTPGLDHQGLGRVSWHDFEYLQKLCDTSSCAKAPCSVREDSVEWKNTWKVRCTEYIRCIYIYTCLNT